MTTAYLDVDSGDVLRIMRRNNLPAGLGLLLFVLYYSNYDEHSDLDEEDFLFFEGLEQSCGRKPRVFWNIVYSGDWDKYTVYDYELVKNNHKELNFSKDEFKEKLEEFQNLWVSLDELLEATKAIINYIERLENLPDTYQKSKLQDDLIGLMDTLLLAKSREGEEVRIKIEN